VTAGRVKWLFLSLQTTQHEAAFEGADDQGGQFRAINIRAQLASPLSFLGNRLQATKPGTESLPSFRPQRRITIVGVNGRVQERAASWHKPSASVPKVSNDLFETIDGIRDLLCSLKARIEWNFPSVGEGVDSKLLLAVKVPVDSPFL
jgi:hypothetical protein